MMAVTTLDGRAFGKFVAAGTYFLRHYRGVLDDLNVFPVPDGGTGAPGDVQPPAARSGVVTRLKIEDMAEQHKLLVVDAPTVPFGIAAVVPGPGFDRIARGGRQKERDAASCGRDRGTLRRGERRVFLRRRPDGRVLDLA